MSLYDHEWDAIIWSFLVVWNRNVATMYILVLKLKVSTNFMKSTLGYKYNQLIYPGSSHLFPLTIPALPIYFHWLSRLFPFIYTYYPGSFHLFPLTIPVQYPGSFHLIPLIISSTALPIYFNLLSVSRLFPFISTYYPGSSHLFQLIIPVESMVNLTSCIDYINIIQPGLTVSFSLKIWSILTQGSWLGAKWNKD